MDANTHHPKQPDFKDICGFVLNYIKLRKADIDESTILRPCLLYKMFSILIF